MINVFQPALGEEELAAVRRVFESNWIGKGRITQEFEVAFASYLDTDAGLVRSVSCCTEGLFQSMSLLNIGAGDEVILPTISFVGAANAVLASGATPIFCDVNPRTLNVTRENVESKISPRTKAVIVLHYGGVPCSIEEICALTQKHDLALIEDAACSIASRWRGQPCGTFGDVAVWSFDAMKILVAGDGGMIRCRTEEMANQAQRQLYLGLKSESGFSSQDLSRWWEFEVESPSRRAIMNDMESAIGLEQLKKVPGFIERRLAVHNFYDAALAAESWLQRPPPIPEQADSSYYFYWIQMEEDIRDELARYLRENDIYSSFRYYPLHRVAYYGDRSNLSGADKAADSTLCIPIHQSLSEKDLDHVVDCISTFGKKRGL